MRWKIAALGLCAVMMGACTPKAVVETDPTDAPVKAEPESAPQNANNAAPQALSADPADMMGSLSEEAFKALHVLSEETAPKLLGSAVEIGGAQAYLSLPLESTGPLPGVILIHEWWGLNDHIRHWADRLAADGYAALAVDLYGGHVAKTPDEAMSLMKGVDPAVAKATLAAAHDFLITDSRVKAQKTGSIGWCFGGGWSLQLALATPELDAAVMYYGRVVDDPEALAALNAELLGIFATNDQGIPPTAVSAFDAALTQAGKAHTIHSYDAEHAFANPSGGRYNQEAASDAWEKVRAFLAAQLKP